ncbi:hypothetical protein FRX31_026809 [Thalictrum thalictroides]|uniref:Uncharacterized protein n=1 Tax=Thalictrum thalictroides TaxID=46969 RepID=A0A7J6VHA8_THATH|nr:hypothetical protein FRX31_026809 [Thalictrum thalictroides]
MYSSQFMDKQIMDLSRSPNNNNDNDIFDLLNPTQEDNNNKKRSSSTGSTGRKDDILPNYDFQPI